MKVTHPYKKLNPGPSSLGHSITAADLHKKMNSPALAGFPACTSPFNEAKKNLKRQLLIDFTSDLDKSTKTNLVEYSKEIEFLELVLLKAQSGLKLNFYDMCKITLKIHTLGTLLRYYSKITNQDDKSKIDMENLESEIHDYI